MEGVWDQAGEEEIEEEGHCKWAALSFFNLNCVVGGSQPESMGGLALQFEHHGSRPSLGGHANDSVVMYTLFRSLCSQCFFHLSPA